MSHHVAILLVITSLLLPSFLGRAQPSVELPGGEEDVKIGVRPDYEKLAQIRNEHALRLYREKKLPEALEAFREALELNPKNPEITNNMAFLLEGLGNTDEAELWYRKTLELDEDRAVAMLNLADLLSATAAPEEEMPARLAEAAELLIRNRELRGNRRTVILKQARIATRRGLFDEAKGFWTELKDRRLLTDRIRMEIGDFYRSFGHEHEALQWYQSIRNGGEISAQVDQKERQIAVDRETRRLGWSEAPGKIPDQARILTSRGRLAGTRGEHRDALRLLDEAVSLAPTFADARAARGEVLRAAGREEEAELSFLRALAMSPADPDAHARLGRLYLNATDGSRAAEAALFLGNALRLRPDWTALHLELARATRRTGALGRASSHAKAYLAAETDPAGRKEAQALLDALKDAPQPAPDGATAKNPGTVGAALARARVLLAGDQADAALEVLLRISDDDRDGDVLELEARCLVARGERARGIRTLQTALIRDETRWETHLLLGRLFVEADDSARARIHLERARDGGLTEASWHLALLALGTWNKGISGWFSDIGRRSALTRARDHLSSYLDADEPRHRADAQELTHRIDARLASQRNVVIVIIALILVALAVWLLRRRGGAGLEDLIRRHPETGPEVQRILAAIRHEILKHNTLLLAGLVEALELDRDASEKAMLLSESLFTHGSAGGSVGERLMAYIDELEGLGRARGMRLNLRGRDPAMGALLKGFDALAEARPLLDRETTLDPGERSRLLDHLRTASVLLNVDAYEALREILDRLRTLSVDEATLLGIVDRVRREPALSRLQVAKPELEIDVDLPAGVLVPKAAFEDALGNLVRNALRSSADHGLSPIHLGLRITTEIDPVIGMERIAFHVLDASPGRLTTEMIRSRHLEGGLGLASDVVARYEGTIEVQREEPPWTKAVVITFDRTHPEEEEA